jgi:hypothetical protein
MAAPLVHRRGHLRPPQRGPLARGEQVVPVEGGVEDAHRHVEVRDLGQVRRQVPCQGHATVGDRDQIQAFRGLDALHHLVRDAHERAPDPGVIEEGARRRFCPALRGVLRAFGRALLFHGSHFLRLTGRN